MVLSPVIPTADGAFWHGTAAMVPVLAAGRQSARRSAKGVKVRDAAAAAVAAADAAAMAAIEAARVMHAMLPPPPPPPEAAAKRAKGAVEKGAKRKRESEKGAEQPAAPPGEATTGKDKKEHDKYCHFCQVWPAARAFPAGARAAAVATRLLGRFGVRGGCAPCGAGELWCKCAGMPWRLPRRWGRMGGHFPVAVFPVELGHVEGL